jgi:hypothetical protein
MSADVAALLVQRLEHDGCVDTRTDVRDELLWDRETMRTIALERGPELIDTWHRKYIMPSLMTLTSDRVKTSTDQPNLVQVAFCRKATFYQKLSDESILKEMLLLHEGWDFVKLYYKEAHSLEVVGDGPLEDHVANSVVRYYFLQIDLTSHIVKDRKRKVKDCEAELCPGAPKYAGDCNLVCAILDKKMALPTCVVKIVRKFIPDYRGYLAMSMAKRLKLGSSESSSRTTGVNPSNSWRSS